MKSLATAVLSIILLVLTWDVSAQLSLPFHDCGSLAVEVQHIVMSPEVPHAGDTLVFKVATKAKRTVYDGAMYVSMYRTFLGRQARIFWDREPISNLLPPGKRLPVRQYEEVELTYKLGPIPFVPRGKCETRIRAYHSRHNLLVCVNMVFSLKQSASSFDEVPQILTT